MQAMREQLQRVPRDSLKLFGNLGLLLMVAAVSVYGILPAYRSWSAINTQYESLRAALDQQAIDSASMTQQQQALVSMREAIQQDIVDLDDQALESRVVAALQEMGWAHAIKLDGISPSAGARIGDFTETRFEVSLQGQYHDLFAMLQSLQQRLGFVVVHSLEMRPDLGAAQPLLLVTLGLSSYRMEES